MTNSFYQRAILNRQVTTGKVAHARWLIGTQFALIHYYLFTVLSTRDGAPKERNRFPNAIRSCDMLSSPIEQPSNAAASADRVIEFPFRGNLINQCACIIQASFTNECFLSRGALQVDMDAVSLSEFFTRCTDDAPTKCLMNMNLFVHSTLWDTITSSGRTNKVRVETSGLNKIIL